jgi:hypothetical protein
MLIFIFIDLFQSNTYENEINLNFFFFHIFLRLVIKMELKITKKDILKSMNINLVQSHKNYLLKKNKNLSSTNNNNNLSDDESDEKLEKKLNQINTVSGSLDSFTSNQINNVDKNIIINNNNKSSNILNNIDGILNIIDSCSIKYDASVYNDKDLIMVGDASNEFLKNSSNNIEINQINCVSSSSTKLEETTNNKPLVLVRFESNESFLLSLHENEHKNNMTIKKLKSTSEMKHIFEMDRY